MKNDISPQYILFQTIKALINKLHDVVRDLNESHEQLEKKMEHRTKRISNYISENEINLINKQKLQMQEWFCQTCIHL